MKKVTDVLTVFIFLAAICLPALNWLLPIIPERESSEKRALEPLPALKVDASLAEFPKKFTQFVADRFPGRNHLVYTYNWLKYFSLGDSPSKKVVIGQDGYLFYRPYLEYHRTSRPLPHATLEAWRLSLQRKRDWLANRGIAYMLVVSPSKANIYPEHVPQEWSQLREQSPLDDLLKHLKKHPDPPQVIDLRQALVRARSDGDLYFRTDSHWNHFGAFKGFEQFQTALKNSVPGSYPLADARWRVAEKKRRGGDLAGNMGLRHDLSDGIRRPVFEPDPPFERKKLSARISSWLPKGNSHFGTECPLATTRAVVFRDSFATALVPYMARSFRTAIFLWTYLNQNRTYASLEKIVAEENPHIVVEQIVDHRLLRPPETPEERYLNPTFKRASIATRTIVFSEPLDDHKSWWDYHTQADLEVIPEGALQCRIHGSDHQGSGQYGGIRFRVDDPSKIILTILIHKAQNVSDIFVDGYALDGSRIMRWQWAKPGGKQETLQVSLELTPGQSSPPLLYTGPTPPGSATQIHLFAKLAGPNLQAELTLVKAQVVEGSR